MLIPGRSVDNSIRSQIGSSAQICADSILDTHMILMVDISLVNFSLRIGTT